MFFVFLGLFMYVVLGIIIVSMCYVAGKYDEHIKQYTKDTGIQKVYYGNNPEKTQ